MELFKGINENKGIRVKDIKGMKRIIRDHEGTVLFRGQSNDNWQIGYSTFRRHKGLKTKHYKLVKMKIESPENIGKSMKDIDTETEIPRKKSKTILVSFTEDILKALWFACSDAKNIDSNGKLFYKTSPNLEIPTKPLTESTHFVLDDGNLDMNSKGLFITKQNKIKILKYLYKKDIHTKTIYVKKTDDLGAFVSLSSFYLQEAAKLLESNKYKKVKKLYRKGIRDSIKYPFLSNNLEKSDLYNSLGNLMMSSKVANKWSNYLKVFWINKSIKYYEKTINLNGKNDKEALAYNNKGNALIEQFIMKKSWWNISLTKYREKQDGLSGNIKISLGEAGKLCKGKKGPFKKIFSTTNYNEARLFIELQEYEEAIKKCNMALKNDSKMALALNAKAVALFALGGQSENGMLPIISNVLKKQTKK